MCRLSSDTVKSVVSLTGDPSEYLKRCCDSLIRVLLNSSSQEITKKILLRKLSGVFSICFTGRRRKTQPKVAPNLYILHCDFILNLSSLFAHLFFCRAVKVFLKAGLTWLSSSTREWQRTFGTAGLGLKVKAVDLNQSEHEKVHSNLRAHQRDHNPLRGGNIYAEFHDNSFSNVKIWNHVVWEPQMTIQQV